MLKKVLLTLTLALLLSSTTFAQDYKIDPAHSQIEFSVDHLMFFKVSGFFTDFVGTIKVDPASKTLSAAEATIQATSIDTRIQKRDDHLRSADFFDVANHPELRFVSKKVEGSANNISVTGDLTIRGVTREVVLDGAFLGENKDAWGNQRAGFVAKGKINRQDYGLTWNKVLETGGVTVGDEVEITLQVQGIKS